MRPRSLLGFVGQLGPQSETPSQQEVNRGSWWEKSFVENGGQGERACDHGGHGPGGGDPYHLGGCKLPDCSNCSPLTVIW